MGVELHVTRAEFWAENSGVEISASEWMSYVASDPELRPVSGNGPHFVRWLGESKYDEPWLDWSRGNVSTKWPDTALYEKMLLVAQRLGAKVQDDDGNVYSQPGDWNFDPSRGNEQFSQPASKPWWKRLFSGRK